MWVNRLAKKLRKNPKLWLELAGVFLVVLIFLLKTTSYLRIDALALPNLAHTTNVAYASVQSYIGELKYFGSCPDGMLKITVGQQYLCREPVKPSIYQKIFDTYPRDPHGREVIYSVLDTGSVKTANDFLNDQYDVPRFKPATFKQLTWNEDPYNNQNWRLNFYSLRIEKDLLQAAITTHDQRYTKKLLAIVNSFIDTGSKQPHAWDDYHAVAWRAMTLTDIWWKLRQQNVLPIADSNKILAAIQQHADFLAQVEHYNEYDSDSSEAAALFLAGANFPDLPGANGWLFTSKDRLASRLNNIIDADGALVERSASTHFSALREYWEIESYALKHHIQIAPDFDSKISGMINYATYILQPDQHVPMLGASLDQQIHNSQEFADIAKHSPQFQYVLTKGKKGAQPPNTSMQFASAGLTMLRSGWGAKNYTQQTQVLFNYGPYTSRGHLDSLGITLYGGGAALLPGAGLYTSAPEPGANFLTATSAANTVLVDGKNQERGAGVAGAFVSKNGYSSQSASEQLNPGVTHERQVTLIGNKTVVVIDKLHSAQEHTYQQLFHLFPGAVYSHKGLTAVAQGPEAQQRLQIEQLATNGITLTDVIGQQTPQAVAGECSLEYGKLIPCRQLAYTQTAKDATFVTVLSIGKADADISYRLANNVVTVKQGYKIYNLAINEASGKAPVVAASDPVPPMPQETVLDHTDDTAGWEVANGSIDATSDAPDSGASALRLTSKADMEATMAKNVSWDMSGKNLAMRLKVDSTDTTEIASLILRSGSAYAEHRIIDSYGMAHGGQWVPVGLATGSSRDQQGQWGIIGQGFDW
ncbi:MAG TPA: heparinase II/III family protein, partial [Candidatus Saccharimonadales bacterium]